MYTYLMPFLSSKNISFTHQLTDRFRGSCSYNPAGRIILLRPILMIKILDSSAEYTHPPELVPSRPDDQDLELIS
jgi:hypothetical protein